MIFPVKRVREELVKEFAASTMTIDAFAEAHSINTEALKSWIDETMHPDPAAKGDSMYFQQMTLLNLISRRSQNRA